MTYTNETTTTTTTDNAESRALLALTFWLNGNLDWNRLKEELDATGLSDQRLGELSRLAQGL